MEIFNHDERIDKERILVVNKSKQPDLFNLIDGSVKQQGFVKGEWRVTKSDEDTIRVESVNQAFGNSRYKVELCGWEMAALLEMLAPHIDNPLQCEMKKQLERATGSLAGLFRELCEKQSEFKRVVKLEPKEKKQE